MGARRAIWITAVYFLAQFLLAIAVGFAAGVCFAIARRGGDSAAGTEGMELLTVPIGVLGVLVAGFLALRMARRTLPGPVGRGSLATLGWRPSSASGIAVAALIGCVVSAGYVLVFFSASPPAEGQQWGPLATAAASGGWARILWSILALVLAPPIEEFVFRGVLFSGLSNAIGIRLAAIIASVVFVLAHVTEVLGYWPAWMGIILMACATVILRIRTGSLLPAIAAHAGYNLIIVIATWL